MFWLEDDSWVDVLRPLFENKVPEIYVQSVAEWCWPLLFPGYYVVSTKDAGMDRYWMPDIVSFNGSSVLLGELKGKCPNSDNIEKSVRQVARYGDEYKAVYPDAEVSLVAIGKWHLEDYYGLATIDTETTDAETVFVCNYHYIASRFELLSTSLIDKARTDAHQNVVSV